MSLKKGWLIFLLAMSLGFALGKHLAKEGVTKEGGDPQGSPLKTLNVKA